jgi:hypothetical protein
VALYNLNIIRADKRRGSPAKYVLGEVLQTQKSPDDAVLIIIIVVRKEKSPARMSVRALRNVKKIVNCIFFFFLFDDANVWNVLLIGQLHFCCSIG